MEKIFVYQIGCGKFGSVFFERIFEVARDFGEAEIHVSGVAEINRKRREKAQEIARKFGREIKTFSHTFHLYKHAEEFKKEGKIVIYDASPSHMHFSHIVKSLEHGFYHLAEKPPYMSRKEMKVLKGMNKKYLWSCDLIEFENPAVITVANFMKANDFAPEKVCIYRFNSIGKRKISEPEHRVGVTGGCLFDKTVHEAYAFEILGVKSFKISSVEAEFMKFNNSYLSIFGEKQKEIDKNTAFSQVLVKGVFSSRDCEIPFELGSGWVGIPENVRKFLNENFRELLPKIVVNDELRIFIAESGDRTLVADMKNFRVHLKERSRIEELPLITLEKDQIYRIFTKFCNHVLGKNAFPVKHEHIEMIMNFIFETRDFVFEENEKKQKQ